MKSRTTARFRKLRGALPREVQALARRAFRQWREDPSYPGVKFKRAATDALVYSGRVGDHYRVLATMEDETVVWFWIGHHSEYDLILRSL